MDNIRRSLKYVIKINNWLQKWNFNPKKRKEKKKGTKQNKPKATHQLFHETCYAKEGTRKWVRENFNRECGIHFFHQKT